MPAVLHLLHGLPGSGKTTYAAKLAAECRAPVFSPDDWMIARHGSNPPAADFARYKAAIDTEIWQQTDALLQQGKDVIHDSGLWTRTERDIARQRAADAKALTRLYSFEADESAMLQRVLQRSAANPDSALQINEAAFRLFKTRFEPLGPDETHVTIRT